jgi:enamine deaminase RidA (YjgF/YER057c/UK114 family)
MTNLKTVLETHGYSMDDLVRCTVMLADISKWGEFNEVYRTFFKDHFPARSAMGVNGLALGAQVEIECTAYRAP